MEKVYSRRFGQLLTVQGLHATAHVDLPTIDLVHFGANDDELVNQLGKEPGTHLIRLGWSFVVDSDGGCDSDVGWEIE